MKADLNKENDSILRKGASAVYSIKKSEEKKAVKLKDAEIKQKTLDYIFGKSDENPLE